MLTKIPSTFIVVVCVPGRRRNKETKKETVWTVSCAVLFNSGYIANRKIVSKLVLLLVLLVTVVEKRASFFSGLAYGKDLGISIASMCVCQRML